MLFDADDVNLPRVGYVSFKQTATDLEKFFIMNPLEFSRSETNLDLTVVENWFIEFQRQ